MTKGQCPICTDIIESTRVHEFVRCKCGACFLDTGDLYIRGGGPVVILDEETEYDDYDGVVESHWALPLIDTPHALVSVIETKIARAVLAERRRIIELIQGEH